MTTITDPCIRKAHEAKTSGDRQIVVWGSGIPRREFLHVDDCADACVHLMKTYSDFSHVNVGSEAEVTILDLMRLVGKIVGFEGDVIHDLSKPDGTPRKLMSGARLKAQGWRPAIGLEEGIRSTYQWFLSNGGGTARHVELG